MRRWLGRIVLYLLFLGVLLMGFGAAAYYAGMRLPVYSDVVAFAFPNWNRTGAVEAQADYDASLVRRDDRIHITVDLAVPETVRRLQAFMDGGRMRVVECGRQVVYVHGMPDARLDVQNPRIGITGTVDIELDGLLKVREGRRVTAVATVGHTPTTVWAQLESLVVDGLPDPLVEPIVRDIARQTYTRDEILAMAAGGLSPSLADLLARHKEALDLRFEDIVPGQQGNTVTLQAVFSINEATAFDMIGEQIAEAGDGAGTALAALAGVGVAQAQLPGGIGDALERMGGADVRDAIEGALEGQDPQEVLGQLAGFADCQTAF